MPVKNKPYYSKIGASPSIFGTEPWTPLDYWKAFLVFLIFATLGLALWALIYTYINRSDLKIKTNSFSSLDPDFKSYFNVPCTNETYGNETKTFSKTTYVVSSCPQTSNLCSDFVCGSDSFCHEETISGGECYSNAQCGVGSRCDLDSCNCTLSNINCTTAADCPIINFNSCQEATCVDGTCSYNLTSGSVCASTTDCAQAETCLSNCTCASVFNIQEYTPTFYNVSVDNPYDLFPPFFLFATFEDKGNWIEIQIRLEAASFDINVTNISFDFDLPVLADTAVDGVGFFDMTSDEPTTTGGLIANGYVSVQTDSTGRAFSPNANFDYVGPNDGAISYGSVSLLYKKA